MANNTFTFDPKKGTVSAVSMVRASREYECSCGHRFSFTVDWPEGLTQNGAMTINGVQCPKCSQPAVLPAARHWVENFQLLSRPLDQ